MPPKNEEKLKKLTENLSSIKNTSKIVRKIVKLNGSLEIAKKSRQNEWVI